jgi:type II secretory pathway pseudopilin PulG
MKLFAVVILSVLLVVLATQIYMFMGRERDTKQNFLDFKKKLDQARADQIEFQSELDYYTNPVNIEKELRARFNYRAPDEKLLILVPRGSSTQP